MQPVHSQLHSDRPHFEDGSRCQQAEVHGPPKINDGQAKVLPGILAASLPLLEVCSGSQAQQQVVRLQVCMQHLCAVHAVHQAQHLGGEEEGERLL